jgi:hypothetical protein
MKGKGALHLHYGLCKAAFNYLLQQRCYFFRKKRLSSVEQHFLAATK